MDPNEITNEIAGISDILEAQQGNVDGVGIDLDDANAEAGQAAQEQLRGEAIEEGIEPPDSTDQGFVPDSLGQFVSETAKAVIGGGADAIDSVGSFLDLSGDTIQTAIKSVLGVQDAKNNPFSKDYESGAWWDIPDQNVPENNSGYGKLARGLVEFGLLSAVTGGIGGKTIGAARFGTRMAKAARVAGFGRKGTKFLKVVNKGATIAGTGTAADIVMQSSEAGNIANLVNEYAPGIPFVEALAVDPEEDTVWISRIKSATAGAGMNVVGHALGAAIRGLYKGAKHFKKTGDVVESNKIVNKEYESNFDKEIIKDEDAHGEMIISRRSEGKGIEGRVFREEYNKKYLPKDDFQEYLAIKNGEQPSPRVLETLKRNHPNFDPATEDPNVIRQLALSDYDELVNNIGARAKDPWIPEQGASLFQLGELNLNGADEFIDAGRFNNAEKATYRPTAEPQDVVDQNLRESVSNKRIDGMPSSSSPLSTEANFRKLARGDKNVLEYVKEIADELSEKIFRGQTALDTLGKKFSYQEVRDVILDQANRLYAFLEDGEDAAKAMREYLLTDSGNKIIWQHDGTTIVTINAAQKAATQLLVHTLGRQIHSIATGATQLPKGVSITRQTDQMFDMMKVLMIEQKKLAYLTGNELLQQRNFVLDDYIRQKLNKGISDIVADQESYFQHLRTLKKDNPELYRHLHTMHQLSGGVVTRLEHIHDYLRAVIGRGGLGKRVNGQVVTPRLLNELNAVYYNSLLSNILTPIKAVFSTNLIATLRPLQAWGGAMIRGNRKEVALAAAQINALGQAYKEGWQMFKHNWELGLNRQKQTYAGKFSVERDLADYEALAPFYANYASKSERQAYYALKGIIDFNTSPYARYSTNLMGSGDAFARTVIGRLEMRLRAAREALDEGVDFKDLNKVAAKMEGKFRNEIFSLDKHKKYVVSDKAATLAGNDAALTTALPETFKAFENLQKMPGGPLFFPFVRTGYNALRLTFAHTELERFTKRFDDVMNGKNLELYGIRPEDLEGAQALMRGRMAMGNAAMVMTAVAALSGMVTGDLPPDKETRDLWKINGIQPNSFTIPGTNTYVSYRNLEPFNTLFSLTANVFSNTHLLGEDKMDEMVEKITFMFASVLVDKSMLAGVDDLVTLLNSDSTGSQLENTLAGLTRRALPYSGLLAGLGKMMHAHEVEANTFAELLFKRDLAMKEALPAKYDILNKDRSGVKFNPNPNVPWLRIFNGISPIAITYHDGDPVKEALMRINFNLPEELTQYGGEELTSFERSELQRLMSMDVDFRKNLENIVSQKWWQSAVKEYEDLGLLNRDGADVNLQDFYYVIKNEFRDAKERAMYTLRNTYSDLDDRILLSKQKQILGKTGDRQQLKYLIENFPK